MEEKETFRAAVNDDEEDAKRARMNVCQLCWCALYPLSLSLSVAYSVFRSYDCRKRVALATARRRDPIVLFHWSIKQIDGRFGSSIVSWFLFCRWIFIWNCLLFLLYFAFLMVRLSLSLPLSLVTALTCSVISCRISRHTSGPALRSRGKSRPAKAWAIRGSSTAGA
jgi:hypothetical protein